MTQDFCPQPRGTKARLLALVLTVTIFTGGCQDSAPKYQGGDINAFQAELKESVESGAISLEEAHVELAIAKKQAKRSERKKKNSGNKVSAYGAKLKQQIKDGELTEEEAATKFVEFQKRFSKKKEKSPSNKTQESADSDNKATKADKEAK